jgi:hypothetical protein
MILGNPVYWLGSSFTAHQKHQRLLSLVPLNSYNARKILVHSLGIGALVVEVTKITKETEIGRKDLG